MSNGARTLMNSLLVWNCVTGNPAKNNRRADPVKLDMRATFHIVCPIALINKTHVTSDPSCVEIAAKTINTCLYTFL